MIKNINAILNPSKVIRSATNRALQNVSYVMLERIATKTPFKFGALRGSIRGVVRNGTIIFFSNLKYALKLHQVKFRKYTKAGTGRFFITNTIRKNKGIIISIFKKVIQRESRNVR